MTDGPARSPGDDESGRAPGWREVVVVAVVIVLVVLGAALATDLLPEAVRSIVLDTPLAIVALVVGTAAVLWRVATRRS